MLASRSVPSRDESLWGLSEDRTIDSIASSSHRMAALAADVDDDCPSSRQIESIEPGCKGASFPLRRDTSLDEDRIAPITEYGRR